MTTEPFRFDINDFDKPGRFNWIFVDWFDQNNYDDRFDAWGDFDAGLNWPLDPVRDFVVNALATGLECQDFEPTDLHNLIQELGSAETRKASELTPAEETSAITALLAAAPA
jgi:hypothetical protein